MCLGRYLTFRARRPLATETLPAFISGLNKAYLDNEVAMSVMLPHAMQEGALEEALGSQPSAAELIAFAEAAHLFIGERGVYAGPPHIWWATRWTRC